MKNSLLGDPYNAQLHHQAHPNFRSLQQMQNTEKDKQTAFRLLLYQIFSFITAKMQKNAPNFCEKKSPLKVFHMELITWRCDSITLYGSPNRLDEATPVSMV